VKMLVEVILGSIGILCCSLVIWGWILLGLWCRYMKKNKEVHIAGAKAEQKLEPRLLYQWDNLLGYDGKEKGDCEDEK